MTQNMQILFTTVFHLGLLILLWRFLIPKKDQVLKALIDEAVKRAPPVEAKDPEEGVPFAVYRKDLLRMAEGQISIDEFVEIWRGRKVQKRPKAVPPLTCAELKVHPTEEPTSSIEPKGLPGVDGLRGPSGPLGEDPPGSYAFGQIFKHPHFDVVLREWAFHVNAKRHGLLDDDGTKFGKLVKGWQENDPALKDVITALVDFMKPRYWRQVLAIMKPYLDPPLEEIFSRTDAEPFYEAFRGVMLHRHLWKFVEPDLPLGKQKCECGEMFDPPKPVRASEVFGTINSVIKDFSKGMADFIDLKAVEAMSPEAEKLPECVLDRGHWVRVMRPTSAAFKQLGMIDGTSSCWIVEVRDVRNEKHLVGLDRDEFDWPPYPEIGEWWAWGKEVEQHGMKCECETPFLWKHSSEDPALRKITLDHIAAGRLYPVNFGRGQER